MDWLEGLEVVASNGDLREPSGLSHDSRLVEAGWAFVALPGVRTDGHAHLAEALDRGAGLLVVQADRRSLWQDFSARLATVVVEDTRAALGLLAANLQRHPSLALRLVGVTGTDGKTSTTHLLAHVLSQCGLSCGYLSSVGFESGAGFQPNLTHMTTVEATSIQADLARARHEAKKAMVVEASSEGLAQGRLNGCDFDVAVFTNLTPDHLDFHGSMDNYLAAKQRLFEMTARSPDKGFGKAAILNGDDPASNQLASATNLPVVRYGSGDSNDVRLVRADESDLGLDLELKSDRHTFRARTRLVGRFNAYNCLSAVATARAFGIDPAAAVDVLQSFPGIPGRLESIDEGQDFRVIVDIASTPAAMEKTLSALRSMTQGRIWVVFGAAGGRDIGRRAGLGAVVGRLADAAVITNEDPRNEDPEAIMKTIASGLEEVGRRAGRDFWQSPDRREAIQFAFGQVAAGDAVLLAGKATEPTMVFGLEERPWDERAVARALLAER